MSLQIKRAYEPPAPADGERILVDRLWPRGLTKRSAAIDLWLRDVAPSTELRRWFGHDPERWEQFQRRYAAELDEAREVVKGLVARARRKRVTLIYAARDASHNHALALRRYIRRRYRV